MSSESLRILRVTSSTYPEVVGGLGLHVHHMSRVQAEMGHDVTVLTSDNGDRSLPREEFRDGYRLVRHREVARPFDNSIIPGLAASLLRLKDEFDVIHAHSHLFFSSNLTAAFSLLDDTPLVVTNHGLVSQTAPQWAQKLFIPTVGRFTFEAADRVLCYTDTDRDRLRDRGIDAEISVIHNGINCSQFSPNGHETKQQLLFVGRLKAGKGAEYLLDAFDLLKDEYPVLSVKIVGSGPLREELQQQATALGIDDRVTFMGEVPNDRLPDLYDESLAFVLPSLSEGLPRTVLEAMACETPVVTTELEQLKPVVGGGGYTVEPKSPQMLAEKLSQLVSDVEKREQMGATGLNKVRNQYSWRETVEQTVEQYREVIYQ